MYENYESITCLSVVQCIFALCSFIYVETRENCVPFGNSNIDAGTGCLSSYHKDKWQRT